MKRHRTITIKPDDFAGAFVASMEFAKSHENIEFTIRGTRTVWCRGRCKRLHHHTHRIHESVTVKIQAPKLPPFPKTSNRLLRVLGSGVRIHHANKAGQPRGPLR